MDINTYYIKSCIFEDSIETAMKKDNGIFYTDIKLAEKIIEFLKIPQNVSIIDPCCGTGNFIMAAKSLGYSSLYGSDTDSKAISLCKKEDQISNLLVMDSIFNPGDLVLKKFKVPDSFDYVIGNPPFAPLSKNTSAKTNYLFYRKVKDSGSNLFVAAIYRAFELAKRNGIISYIIPKNFLHVDSYGVLRRMILDQKRILSIIDLGPIFKHVRGEQVVITMENDYVVNNNIEIYKLVNNHFEKRVTVPQKYYSDEILLFNSEIDYKIYNKLQSSYQKFSDICTGYVGRGKSKSPFSISGKDIRKFSFKNINVPQKGNKVFIQNIYSSEAGIIACFAGNLEAGETVTVFTDSDEKMCRYILGILHSRLCNYYLMNFCYNNSKLTMHTDSNYLKKIPLVVKDGTFSKIVNIVKALERVNYMTESWFELFESLNELIYDTYNIDMKERMYIDTKIKNNQSQKWNYDRSKKKMQ